MSAVSGEAVMLRSRAEREALEAVLGEPLMVDDPWITVRQAASVLGLRPEQVRELINAGALCTREAPHGGGGSRANRRLLLSEVLAHKSLPIRIGVVEAAHAMGVTSARLHRLVEAGLLVWLGGSWPLLRADVDQLVERRHGWLTITQAAAVMDVPVAEVRQFLDDGLLRFTGDTSRPVDRVQLDNLLAALGRPRRAGKAGEWTPPQVGTHHHTRPHSDVQV